MIREALNRVTEKIAQQNTAKTNSGIGSNTNNQSSYSTNGLASRVIKLQCKILA